MNVADFAGSHDAAAGGSRACSPAIGRTTPIEKTYRDKLHSAGRPAQTLAVVDRLFQSPMISIPQVAEFLGVTDHAAQTNAEHRLNAGILEDVAKRGNPTYFAARALINIIQDTMTGHARSAL